MCVVISALQEVLEICLVVLFSVLMINKSAEALKIGFGGKGLRRNRNLEFKTRWCFFHQWKIFLYVHNHAYIWLSVLYSQIPLHLNQLDPLYVLLKYFGGFTLLFLSTTMNYINKFLIHYVMVPKSRLL